ncbi:MAG TPA: hypothetical protein VIK32_08075, partial [Candidatus Limnocylindrales bacterium]
GKRVKKPSPPPTSDSWPLAIRRVRGWLTPWVMLRRWWQAWSVSPPPPELQALLRSVGNGQPLNLYLRP